MARKVYQRVILILMVELLTASAFEYNCIRSGSECGAYGTCNHLTGKCSCTPGFTGHNCKVRTELINAGMCRQNNPCGSRGQCFDMGDMVTKCYCNYGFYGDVCQFPIRQNECLTDKMIVNINPGEGFAGVVGLQSITGFCDLPLMRQLLATDVPYLRVQGRDKWQGYAASLSFTIDPCGGMPHTNYTTTGTTYTYEVLIQYDPFQTTPVDEVVSFSCIVPATTPGRTALLFTVTDSAGGPVTSPRLGSYIFVNFSVNPNSIFSDLTVRSCIAYDSARSLSKAVIMNSCAVQPLGVSVVKAGVGRNILTLLVHKFGTDPQISVECSVKMCTPLDSSCGNVPLCDTQYSSPVSSSMGRRKREVIGHSDVASEYMLMVKATIG